VPSWEDVIYQIVDGCNARRIDCVDGELEHEDDEEERRHDSGGVLENSGDSDISIQISRSPFNSL
jgi:hypothetical protein